MTRSTHADRHKRLKFKRRGTLRAMAALIVLARLMPCAMAQDITTLGTFNGGGSNAAIGLSADGNVVVGGGSNGAAGGQEQAFRWTLVTGFTSLGVLNGGNRSFANGISADSSVIVGDATDGAAANKPRAFRWNQTGGMVSLGTLPGLPFSRAQAASADGTAVVGYSYSTTPGDQILRAFRWTPGNGMVDLGGLNGNTSYAVAAGISGDGGIVVGEARDAADFNRIRAFRWTTGTGMQSLGTLNGGANSIATAISADGTTIVGRAENPFAGNAYQAMRWTQATGMRGLGGLNGGDYSDARAVSANGSVVVGFARDGTSGFTLRAFRWTQANGLVKVEDWLRAAGVRVPTDVTREARGVSADGTVVVGQTDAGLAYIARVAAAGSGLITIADFLPSLAVVADVSPSALRIADLTLFGAHHRSLHDDNLPAGNCAWITGDFGQQRATSSRLTLAEVGVCGDFAQKMRLGIGIGESRSQADTDASSSAKVRGQHLYLEASYAHDSTLVAGFSAYVWRGDAHIRRGYSNAGVADTSTGTPGVDSVAWRARIDWRNLARMHDWSLSPYAALSQMRSSMAAYIETGGGFPAAFDKQTTTVSDLRAGAVLRKALSEATDLRLSAETVGRLSNHVNATSGRLLGPGGFAFDFAPRSERSKWVRVGAEIDHRLTRATLLSLSVNSSTQDGRSNWWASASWRTAF